ncbi:hypothetical protein ZHAS_00011197 [Anopheles sinensis]|uniref:Uncharacterized protein n=1 Tax=Anopheles sinensis TaxID=74873 RepID=A0A084VZK6_ANOSI|nr:hypothetical protein ZHAS_00011197 [Anopheles sinensis]
MPPSNSRERLPSSERSSERLNGGIEPPHVTGERALAISASRASPRSKEEDLCFVCLAASECACCGIIWISGQKSRPLGK